MWKLFCKNHTLLTRKAVVKISVPMNLISYRGVKQVEYGEMGAGFEKVIEWLLYGFWILTLSVIRYYQTKQLANK